MTTKALAGLVGLTCLLMMVPAPVLAAAGDQQVRFGIVFNNPMGDSQIGSVKYELDGSAGFQASYEYMLRNKLGIEGAAGVVSFDAKRSAAGIFDETFGDVRLFSLTATLNFHLLEKGKVDLFVGPTIGYASWGDLDDDVFQVKRSTDTDFVFGANLGVDVPFGGKGWAFATGLSYLMLDLPVDDLTDDIGVDPLQLKVGLRYRF